MHRIPAKVEKKITFLVNAVRNATVRRDYLSQWGLNNWVVTYRIKVRLMEDLIDLA